MRLELSTHSLDVRFDCIDDDANDLEVLDTLRALIDVLEQHVGVHLTIVSKPELSDDEEDSEEVLDDADPV